VAIDLVRERLSNGHVWWRIADHGWSDPLDSNFAAARGGRWNPPNSHRTLYFNEDVVTARLNLRLFTAQWPYEPEDLRRDTGPILVGATLPRGQTAADVHTRLGVARAGLHQNYPFDLNGKLLPHRDCQRIGVAAKATGLRGIRARSAQSRDGAGRELAWFPASIRSIARRVKSFTFEQWYWG
jgi:hypothetical protein